MEAVAAAVSACTQKGYGVTATVIDADAVRIAMLRGDTAADTGFSSAGCRLRARSNVFQSTQHAAGHQRWSMCSRGPGTAAV
jgi:uncharacterized protein GlcG (DUF336 family)